ncbi:hypothetical protein Desaci_0339 [Desulfosporosinus acidiphilus SJ4]|uniref:DUF4352 domain-containing protein n=1 Tax=Desulfosporosinus acidiphilus (strain DSM 22704 / JCM 16185 / SJ4) TaxID=646529 RepID=I4D0T7_DESAJ|nr:hypothetical protein [Desulfosporosinus acidiphilus]AFM39411.1 hypothetical protein Desaci_0339 [Desulfosporosinus acidiphilus SJ4]
MRNKQRLFWQMGIALILVILGLGLYVGFNFPPKFDDKVVSVSLMKQELTPDGINYTLKVENNSSYTLKDNTLYFTARRYMMPVKAKATQGNNTNIKPGGTVTFMVYVPKKQFQDLQSSQTITSVVMLKGYVSWWFWKVPFNKGGGIDINHPTLA